MLRVQSETASARDRRALVVLLLVVACRPQPPASAARESSPAACAAEKQELIAFLAKLPERAVASGLRIELPESTLGAAPGSGPLLELSETSLYLDGTAIEERNGPDRGLRIEQWAQRWLSAKAGAGAPTLYVAASPGTDVRTLRAHLAAIPAGLELRLLVRTRGLPRSDGGGRASSHAHELASSLLAERDASRRQAIATEAYARFSECSAVERAVAAQAGRDGAERWRSLRAALLEALPGCACDELDAPALQQVLAAEQRAGAASLGSLPIAFLRDERCGASMPLRGIGKLVRQMEGFDAEFAGGWRKDALEFEEVLGNERLLGFFCNALPGETLAARQRARGALYWRVPGSDQCQVWQFEPLAPGAPMGTWRRATGQKPLAFHYWQAAEEIRLFGPVPSGPSKPTDEHAWPCTQNYRLTGVDAEAIRTDAGSWFFSESTCRAAPAEALGSGCVSALSNGGAPDDSSPPP